MLDKLEQIENRYAELTQELSSPELLSNPSAYGKAAKQHRTLGEVVHKFQQWKGLRSELEGARELFDTSDDEEMREMARLELESLQTRLDDADRELKLLLIPTDPNDEKNVILEIRAGTGGDEATLFAAEMVRMYSRYAEKQRWKFEVLEASESGIGGLKEAIVLIEGDKVYSRLKHESGVHRVQRVPQTEASGRIHTSAITVAVLPEAEEVDVKIEAKDLRIDTFCSSGPGGQSVNTTYSAVRITHIPTNTVVSCQDEKSQIKNREKAMKVLRARLYEVALEEQQKEIARDRKSQVGSGDRSEKIRTYNFPQARVSDHRIGLTLHRLQDVLDGDLDEVVGALIANHQAEKLRVSA